MEWHLAPEQIFEHWSDEKFLAMWDKRNERIEQQNERAENAAGDARPKRSSGKNLQLGAKYLSDPEFVANAQAEIEKMRSIQ